MNLRINETLQIGAVKNSAYQIWGQGVYLFFKFIINIRIQRINPQIQDVLIAQAQGRFDPVISLGSDADWSEQPSLTPFITGADVRTSNTQGFVFGFDDPIFTGGSYGMYSLFESVRGRLQNETFSN